MKTLSVLIITVLVMVFLPYCLHFLFYNGLTHNDHYYMQKTYACAGELFSVLVQKSTNLNNIFLWCCDCILFFAKKLDMTYEEFNIYLFIIWQPYLIFLFAFLFVVKYRENVKLRKQVQRPTLLASHAA